MLVLKVDKEIKSVENGKSRLIIVARKLQTTRL